MGIQARCDGLGLGALLAVLCADRERLQRHSGPWTKGFLLTAAVCAAYLGLETCLHVSSRIASAVLGDIAPGRIEGANLILWNLLATSVVGTCVVWTGHRRLAALRDSRLAYIGKISYGLYLYHYPIFSLLKQENRGADLSPGAVFAAVGATFVLAALSWRFVEEPILRLKSRFSYGDRRAAPESSAIIRAGSLAPEPK